MSKPDPDDPKNASLQHKLSKAAADLQRPTSESAKVRRRLMLDEGDDEAEIVTHEIEDLFDNPEKF